MSTAPALGLQAYPTALSFLTQTLGVELRFSACLPVLRHLSSPGSAMQASVPGVNPRRLLLIGIRRLEPTLSQTLRFGGEKYAILFLLVTASNGACPYSYVYIKSGCKT